LREGFSHESGACVIRGTDDKVRPLKDTLARVYAPRGLLMMEL
jgi:hypothetical protein